MLPEAKLSISWVCSQAKKTPLLGHSRSAPAESISRPPPLKCSPRWQAILSLAGLRRLGSNVTQFKWSSIHGQRGLAHSPSSGGRSPKLVSEFGPFQRFACGALASFIESLVMGTVCTGTFIPDRSRPHRRSGPRFNMLPEAKLSIS